MYKRLRNLVYLGCLAIVSQYGAMLNAEGKFVAAASAPILLNLAMTAALLMVWLFPTAGHAAAYGVLVGGVLELALLYIGARRSGMNLAFTGLRRTPEVMRFARNFGPAVLGSASVQIGLFADTIIASFLPPGGLT